MRSLVVLTAFVVAGCASAPAETLVRTDVPWPELFPSVIDPDPSGQRPFVAKAPTPELIERLQVAERTFRAEEEEFATVRDELASDPLGAFHLTRFLVFWRIQKEALVRRARQDEPFLVESVGATPWSRAEDEVVSLGAAAAPALVLDIARATDDRDRTVRIDLVGRIGDEAIPTLEIAFQAQDWQARRDVVRTLRAMSESGDPDQRPSARIRPLLERGIVDPHWAVRASAYEGLVRFESSGQRFRDALKLEQDRFVRRSIVLALASYRHEPQNAAVLVDYLERSVEDEDIDQTKTAQQALERYSGRLDKAGVLAWTAWLKRTEAERRR